MSDPSGVPRYRCLALPLPEEDGYTLRPVARDDLAAIMHWRNEQLDVLRGRAPLTPADQDAYWRDVVEPGFSEDRPRQILLTYLHGAGRIGYGGLVHIAWEDRRAEVSFLDAPERAADPAVYGRDLSTWLRLLRRVAFGGLGLQRLFTETYDLRPQHVALLEAGGFEPEGRMRRHVIIRGRPVDSLLHGCLDPRAVFDE
jgi:RimJ/RimL family protein N-acetyltransferase